ncbi:MAG: transcription termination/antitermination protein NusG [Oscillospiraceae bacterium]|nr:transcription termination/antitermination protein NusG [Oscillospiraceae bacterium]MCL2279234.1 transcription termination/antitermination protein NusG [Oscillospiraceae bacterium]
MAMDEARWYVVHTYSGYENAVAATVMKAAENRKMLDQVLEVKIPTETITEIHESQTKTVERKTFPGYVIIKMVMNDVSWHLVRNVRGVTGFVGSANKAIPLTEDEVLSLGIERHEVVVGFDVGSTVKVVDGPLDGFLGNVEEIEFDKSRARVIVSMFGRETPVDLDFDQIEPIE